MSDDLDLVQARLDVEVAAALTRISGTIPEGVRGECDDCGEDMPRLVGGLCGFCRDGRRPPLDRYPIPTPIAPVQPRLDVPVPVQAATAPAIGAPIAQEDDDMANKPPSKDYQAITMPAEGRALAAIREHAAANDLPLGRAALALFEDGLSAIEVEKSGSTVDLDIVSLDDLFAEIRARIEVADQQSELLARAEAAEAKLAAIVGVIVPAGDVS